MKNHVEMKLGNEKRIEILKNIVTLFLDTYELRCYQKPVKVNGWPFGYARTFKIKQCKKRSKRK